MFFRILKNLLPLFFLAACATVPDPPVEYSAGAVVKTLSSAVSISIQASDRGISGSGYLVYRRPDQLHLVMLSPFGTVMMEAFAHGDRIALLYPASSIAYIGRFDELPEKGGLQGWNLMHWVMDADPHEIKTLSGSVERASRMGFSEKVIFENGLIVSKESSAGDKVQYRNYVSVKGVPVATEMELHNIRDDRIRINISDPEVNTALADAVFTPKLDGVTILPLSTIQGL